MITIFEADKIKREDIFARNEPAAEVSGTVREIINNVRINGDKALSGYLEKFDKVKLSDFKVSKEEIKMSAKKVEPEFLDILKEAEANIRAFHEKQVRQGFRMTGKAGVILGQRVVPIEKVGIYVPGGTAAYPSTVLMDAVPAKIVGVSEIIMVTPPNQKGEINPYILAAANIAGITAIYKLGGAQAVAALAYGTETVPRVDKIVGPGNAFVAEAKKQVFGQVGIDMIAGPSEVLVLADGESNPKFVAADLLSQAEHDKNASCVLITESESLAKEVQKEIEAQLVKLPREEIARASIENNGKIIIGGLQGMQKNKSTEEIKKITKNFYGIFPKRLVIEVLYLLFPNYNKIAVGNKGHIYLSLRYKFKKNRKINADYDEFWESLGSQKEDDVFWSLPKRIARKNIEDIPSKKRSQYTNKYKILDELNGRVKKFLLINAV